MKIVVFPGSFDPVTNGHLDIIERASLMFDKVIVAILEHPKKQTMFTTQERLQFLNMRTKHLQNVECMVGNGLSVHFAKEKQACALVRGVRTVKDFEYEQNLAYINQKINKDIETILLYSNPSMAHISSSAVKEMASYGVDVSAYVGEKIAQKLKEKMLGGTR